MSITGLNKLFLFICNILILQIDWAFTYDNKGIKHIYCFHQLLKQKFSITQWE